MDLGTLRRAYDRSAAGYDARFRELQRPKYRAAAAMMLAEKVDYLNAKYWHTNYISADALHANDPPARGPGLILDAGAGTGLWLDWAGEPGEPHAELREAILAANRAKKLIALDASAGMLREACARSPLCVAADLARPPLRPASCALVVSFTALLEEVPRALRALGELVMPGGTLCASFLARESPSSGELARWSGLHPTFPPVAAGQDLVHLVRRRR